MLRLLLRLFWCSTPSIPFPPPPSLGFASIIHSRYSFPRVGSATSSFPHRSPHLLFLIFFAGLSFDPSDCSGLLLYFERWTVCVCVQQIFHRLNRWYEASAGEIKISRRLCFLCILRVPVFIYLFIFILSPLILMGETRNFLGRGGVRLLNRAFGY